MYGSEQDEDNGVNLSTNPTIFRSYVPLLVQLHQKWRRLYRGLCLGSGFRTLFEMAQLRHTPKQFNHLKGLLDVFKDKLVCSLAIHHVVFDVW